MYDLEKNVPLSPMINNTTEHEASHLNKNDLNHPSDILENYYEEANEAMKVSEPSIDNLKNLKEVQSANQDLSVAQLLSNHRELPRRAH